jgi:hypothetical protein
MSADHSGGCRCGAVRFSSTADPHHVSYCHCADCRRASGAPVSAFVGFMRGKVEIIGSTLTSFENGPVTRSFCGTCGSPIAYVDARIGDHIYFMLGAMDMPAHYEPALHAHVREQLPCVLMPDGLPRHLGTSVPRPDGIRP